MVFQVNKQEFLFIVLEDSTNWLYRKGMIFRPFWSEIGYRFWPFWSLDFYHMLVDG